MKNAFGYISAMVLLFIGQLILWIVVFPESFIQGMFFSLFVILMLAYLLMRVFLKSKLFNLLSISILISVLLNSFISLICYKNFMDNSIGKGVKIVEVLESYKGVNGRYPNKLEELFKKEEWTTSINTPYTFVNKGSYFFLQFDWTGTQICYYDYNKKAWFFTELKEESKSKIVEYELRTW